MSQSGTASFSTRGHTHVEALDLLRMIAALSVAIFHFSVHGPFGASNLALPEIAFVAKYGYLGVQLFFIISGFVIAYSADGRIANGFAIARVARIYPGFVFCMTVTFLTTLVFGVPQLFETTVTQWAANLFIIAPVLNQPYMDSVYWTIVIELIFYAWIYVLMVGGIFRRRIDVVLMIWLAL